MPDTFEESVEAAELAVFDRKKASLDEAADAGSPGRFESFRMGELRASMATADQYGFLNAIEGLTNQSVEVLPDVLGRFPDPHQPAIIATFPSPELIDWLLGEGYEPAPARPLAYWRPRTDFSAAAMSLHATGYDWWKRYACRWLLPQPLPEHRASETSQNWDSPSLNARPGASTDEPCTKMSQPANALAE